MNETARVQNERIQYNGEENNFNPIMDKYIPHDDRIKEYSTIKTFYITLMDKFHNTFNDFERAMYLLKIYRAINSNFDNIKPHKNYWGCFNYN